MNKKGFTLVELLAVIVILAVILVIAVPRIADVINNTKMSSLKNSAQMIVSEAENKYEINKMLGESTSGILCNDLVILNNDDYGSCRITFDSVGNATVTLNGKENGKFDNMSCTGPKSGINCQTGLIDVSTPATCFTTEATEIVSYTINYDNCVTFFTNDGYFSAESIELICTGEEELEYGNTMNSIIESEDMPLKDYLVEERAIENVEYGISIIEYDSNCEKDVIIPTSIDGYNVVKIGENAFDAEFAPADTKISSVILPDGLKKIGNYAFADNNITRLTIPDSVVVIGTYAFLYNQINELDLGEGVERIDYRAFVDNNITKLTIPDSTIVIDNGAFEDNQINEIHFPSTPLYIYNEAFLWNPFYDENYTFPSNITILYRTPTV